MALNDIEFEDDEFTEPEFEDIEFEDDEDDDFDPDDGMTEREAAEWRAEQQAAYDDMWPDGEYGDFPSFADY